LPLTVRLVTTRTLVPPADGERVAVITAVAFSLPRDLATFRLQHGPVGVGVERLERALPRYDTVIAPTLSL